MTLASSGDGPGDGVSIDVLPLETSLNDELSPENDDSKDDIDTSRVVSSATSYARECMRTENYADATIALQSALKIAEPSSNSYKMTVLHVAQLLKAAQQLKASIDCMLSVYQSMPPPFSRTEGICIIARMYEQLESTDAARFWWRNLATQPVRGSSEPAKPDFMVSEEMADRFFDEELCMFAADFYGQALMLTSEKIFVPSNRFRYRYLVTLLAFVGPRGPTMHKNLCTEVAWSMAQWFRRQNGNGISACYGDLHYYRLRLLYSTTFPAIYRAVFAWVDGPAGRIARWWRRQWIRFHPPLVDSLPSNSRAKHKLKKKLTRDTAQSEIKVHPFLRRKVPLPVHRSPSPMRKKHDDSNKKDATILQHDVASEPRSRTEKSIDTSCNIDTKQLPNRKAPVLSNNASSNDELQRLQVARRDKSEPSRDARREMKIQFVTKKSRKNLDGSSSKRGIGTRQKGSSGELVNEEPSSSGSDEVEAQSTTSSNLLEVYPLQLPNSENFVEICGREPGFADLNLDEVSAFARLVHYRARVLAGDHAQVDNLDATKVKPQWLESIEKATALVVTHQQRNLASGKMVADGDSFAHMSEVHTRLVLLITTLCRQYTRNFGETSFTRRLRVMTRRLIGWKFSRISEVFAALDDAKAVATHEEKQRNLEFYHVHRNRK